MFTPISLLNTFIFLGLLLQSTVAFYPSKAAFGGTGLPGRTGYQRIEKMAQQPSVLPSKLPQQQPKHVEEPIGWSCRIISGPLFGKKEARAEGNARKGASSERVKKPKDDVIEITGVVIDSLPNAMFRVTIDGAPETQEPILATISGKIRKNFVKILVGDKVKVELSPYDLTRGRITFRTKSFP